MKKRLLLSVLIVLGMILLGSLHVHLERPSRFSEMVKQPPHGKADVGVFIKSNPRF